jgi:hypothetical protein
MPWGLQRLSEKTLELNFASQLNHRCGGSLLWFGLTQKQEAECGFDIATKIGTSLFIVQMKASSHVLKNSLARNFKVPHDQLQQLRAIKVGGRPLPKRSVFYAFPVIGTVHELNANPDIVANTWLCDVADCSSVGAPTKASGERRKDGCHYVHVSVGMPPIPAGVSGFAEWHSDPVKVAAIHASSFADELNRRDAGRALLSVMNEGNFADFWRLSESFYRKAFGIVQLKPAATQP